MSLSFEPYYIFSSSIGECNPLPDIKNVGYIHASMRLTENAEKARPANFGKGMINSMLPYQTQDNYDREKKDRYFQAAILENDYLKAIFLPELGGRLWSLIDKKTGRELLYKNPVFQPCNLALRNAWFSGGVEWNVSIKGHNPLTCSPMFASIIQAENGERGLRLYEYERIRNIAYSMDVWLPADSPFLIVHPRIENNTPDEKYMYWWSNIAYPNHKGVRVVVPAENSFISSYRHGSYIMDYQTLTHEPTTDTTYPENNTDSYDYFYDIPQENQKWITAIEEDGYGLFQCSTKELTGRKLFVWGTSRGGKNWNEFLSVKGSGYFEIQAGLAKTQLEHLPMKPYSVWEWTEIYGAVQTQKEEAFSADWNKAVCGVEKSLTAIVGGAIDKQIERAYEPYKKATTVSVEQYGSGWGYLKNAENVACNLPPISQVVVFPRESIKKEEDYFLRLLEKKVFPCPDVKQAPVSYNFSKYLKDLLDDYVKTEKNNWFTYYHLGVMQYAYGELEFAEKSWNISVACQENAWALRNIAMLYRNEYGDFKKASDYMERAFQLLPNQRNLVQDYLETLLKNQQFEQCVCVFDELDNTLQAIGKLQYCKAYALTKLKKVNEARAILNPNFKMDDIKEGDISIADLWYELYGQILLLEGKISTSDDIEKSVETYYPLGDLDFRMHTKKG